MGQGKRFSFSGLVLLALSLLYLGGEVYFNMRLLEVAGSVASNPEEIDSLQVFGRAVSASGCFLLVLGFFARTGFRVETKGQKASYALALLLSASCIAALLLQGMFKLASSEIFMCLLSVWGVALVVLGRGKSSFCTVLSLLFFIWPAVFLGQKFLIEHYLIEKTDWQQRINARYALMLRGAIENCSIMLEDMNLCDDSRGADNIKSARIIVSALWLLHPEGVRHDISVNKESLMQAAAAKDTWFSTREQYDLYVDKVTAERSKIEDEMIGKYYAPYKKASDMYLESRDSKALRQKTDLAADDIDRRILRGWQEYRDAQRQYRNMLSSMAAQSIRQAMPLKGMTKNICDRYDVCRRMSAAGSKALGKAESEAEHAFWQKTGYPPDIETREEFAASFKTRAIIRGEVEKHIRESMGIENFHLPEEWVYDRENLFYVIDILARQEMQRKWTEKFSTLPPGLSMDEFFAKAGVEPLPSIEQIVMSEDDFFKSVILPEHKKMAVKMLDEIEAEKLLYANGRSLEKKGKDYVRALYIPIISLVVSLLVVMLTLIRGLNVTLSPLLNLLPVKFRKKRALRKSFSIVMTAFLALSLFYLTARVPNPYAESVTYQRYLQNAYKENKIMASVLDWVLHAQPVVYKIGRRLSGIMS